MIIKLGDMITDDRGRVGELVNIGISTSKADPAAESDLSLNAKEYDTDLNYTGAITFGSNWCYFYQIKNVSNQNDSDIDVAVEQANEWWK